jgi:antitoxin VapB
MSLNIENEETLGLIRQLAELLGQSPTSVVEDAVRRRLEELERTEGRSARRASMMRIARESADQLDPVLSNDPNEFLYDKLGMPQPSCPFGSRRLPHAQELNDMLSSAARPALSTT